MRKLFIFSELSDNSTSKIIRWLHHFGKDVTRINIDDRNFTVSKCQKDFSRVKTSFSEYTIYPSDIIWFRRASNIFTFIVKGDISKYEDVQRSFRIRESVDVLKAFFNWLCINCECIGNPEYATPNKVKQLLLAEKIGLKCPEWIMTQKKTDVVSFFNNHKTIVNKTFNHFSFFDSEMEYKILTSIVTEDSMKSMPETFNTVFLQEFIAKKYELRVFFWGGTFFPMAIFSQQDEKTKVDFRNYNHKVPNRRIPVQLSEKYISKLKLLAKGLNIDTGSFDILVSDLDEYFFLEVNPVGQFGMVSYPCNYQIEKFIATHFSNML